MDEEKNKNTEESQTQDWKRRFDDILNTCSEEIKKTAAIGKNMFNASNANSKMNESFEEMGRIVFNLIKNEKIKVEDPRVAELISTIEQCGEDLTAYEKELNEIKSR